MEITNGTNQEGTGSGIGKNYVLWDPKMTNNGPNKNGGTNRPAFIGPGHELAHMEDRWKGTMNKGTWFSVTTPNGGTAKVSNAELYATYRENQLRSECNVPLRTHYLPDTSEAPYEPSRIIKAGTRQSIYFDSNGLTNYQSLNKTQAPFTYPKY